MMNKLIFGRFIPGDSFIHKLDPRVKFLFYWNHFFGKQLAELSFGSCFYAI